MFFKLAQNFFGKSLGTPLTEKHITDHIPAHPTPYIRHQFFSCFYKNPFLVKSDHYCPISRFQIFTRGNFRFLGRYSMFGVEIDSKFFSETIWRLMVRENTYPIIYPHIRHQKSKIDFWYFFQKMTFFG